MDTYSNRSGAARQASGILDFLGAAGLEVHEEFGFLSSYESMRVLSTSINKLILKALKQPAADAQGYSIHIWLLWLCNSIQAQNYLSQQLFKFFHSKPGSFN